MDTGIFVFLFWDMVYSGILGYGILEFILGYELNYFWDMGCFGRFLGIWDIAYPPNPASLYGQVFVTQLRSWSLNQAIMTV